MTTGATSPLTSLAGSHLLSIADLDRDQILAIVESAIAIKKNPPADAPLAGRSAGPRGAPARRARCRRASPPRSDHSAKASPSAPDSEFIGIYAQEDPEEGTA